MENFTENFRNILAAKVSTFVRYDQLQEILSAFDAVASGYDIVKKQVDLITTETVPEVVKIFLASKAVENCSLKTLDQYRYKLINFFSAVKKPYTDVTTNDIRVYLYNYKTSHNISEHTVENTRLVFNSFFQWLEDNEYIKTNPCARIERVKFQQKKREPLSSYDLELLRWNCKTLREKALIDFLFSTGCRVSECSDVNKSDVNWGERSVLIRHGKGNKMRTVYFNAESELSLRLYLDSRDDFEDALFVCSRAPHNRLSARGIENEIKGISERAHVKAFPHKLRHTFATFGLHGGMPIERLQALMGHADTKTTLVYAKMDCVDLQREHSRVYA